MIVEVMNLQQKDQQAAERKLSPKLADDLKKTLKYITRGTQQS